MLVVWNPARARCPSRGMRQRFLALRSTVTENWQTEPFPVTAGSMRLDFLSAS